MCALRVLQKTSLALEVVYCHKMKKKYMAYLPVHNYFQPAISTSHLPFFRHTNNRAGFYHYGLSYTLHTIYIYNVASLSRAVTHDISKRYVFT